MASLGTRPRTAGEALDHYEDFGDATINNCGSLFQITPHTQAAKDWLRENVQADGMWLGNSLCVEHRFISDLAQGMLDAGLKVS